MTLIAFACHDDHAEILTDSASYLPGGRQFGRSTKITPITHLDAVCAGIGDTRFKAQAIAALLTSHQQSPATFDEAVQNLPTALRELTEALGPFTSNTSVPNLFLIGYSHQAAAFKAYRFSAVDGDFAATVMPGMFVTPAPYAFAPSAWEVAGIRAGLGDQADEFIQRWQQQPEPPVPTTEREWLGVAHASRKRAVDDSGAGFVAGDIVLTRLERGSAGTRRIGAFDDSGEEFQAMVAGTSHPQSQLAACPCGSGEILLDCHLKPYLDQACECGSSRAFRDCCMVERPALVTEQVAAR